MTSGNAILNRQAWQLATICDERAKVLETEAAELTSDDAAERRQMKIDAAVATRKYAAHLRGAADLDQVTQVDLDRGRLVADAAGMGGFLVDGHRLNGHDPNRYQRQRDLEAAGFFQHVAEDHQVPYFRLRVPEATSENTADNVAEA